MAPRSVVLAALLVAAVAAGCTADGRQARPGPAQPAFVHRLGAYGVGPGEAAPAAGAGITVAITDYRPPGTAAGRAFRNARVSIIDRSIESIVYAHLPRSCATSTAPCAIAQSDVTAILNQVRAHLTQVADDPAVVGFYVLDDYPGSIGPLLARVRSLIAGANRRRGVTRPIVCGFSADLDFRVGNSVVEPRHAMRRALTNYSPAACDAVLMYSYGYRYAYEGHLDSDAFDWTMANVLPDFFGELRARGWTEKSPFIGTPMAFDSPSTGYTGPTSAQLASQVEAFCAAGATSVIAFAWHVFDRPADSLANRPQLKAGLRSGIAACQARWRAAAVAQTTPTPRATPPITSVG